MCIMVTEEWSKFKSGSDIRGTAVDSEKEPLDLTDEKVKAFASAFVVWLSEKTGKAPDKLVLAVGHDSRISAPRLKADVLESFVNAGAKVFDCGLASTPSMFMTTQEKITDTDGALQLTASHHPYNKNGLKFFTKDGGLEGSDISKIIEYASEGKYAPLKNGNVVKIDFMKTYSEGLVNKVRTACGSDRPLEGFKIVVDAGNGAGGFYVDRVLKPLGANTEGSQFLDPDGMFPNHIPNPENKTAMAAICDCVKSNNADLGLIFDTDVDRAGAVSSDGEEINRNRLIALISAILLEEHPGSAIVTDSVTSDGLNEFITAAGGVHHRFKRGYKNVINEAVRLNKEGVYCPLAIETSGHAALKENYFLDDGAYLVTRLIIKAAQLKKENKELEDLIKDLKMPLEEGEIRLGFFEKDFKPYGMKMIEDLTAYSEKQAGFTVAPSNYEGVRVSLDKANGDGWFLVRMSLHDPIVPINIESNEKGGVKKIAEKLYSFMKKYSGLDLTNLKKFINLED